jgi:hypothetical protein
MSVHDICKAVTTDRVIALKVAAVHIPEFTSAQPRILLSDSAYILQHKRFLGSPQQYF